MPLVGTAWKAVTGLLVIALLSMACQSTPATPKPTVAQGPDGPPVAPPSIEPQELEELQRVVADVDAVAASIRADPGDLGERWRPATGQTLAEFMDLVNDDLESFWRTAFGRAGQGDLFQTLVPHFLEEGETGNFACGRASSQDGAYYCHFEGAMEMVIGVDWMDEDIYRAHGPVADFAVATVIAHEWGHHIQHLIGALIGTSPGRCCGLFTVQTELNADCMAGMWAFSQYGRGQLEEGDIAEAVQASEDAGDLPFSPPTRTGAHGQPEQRVEWFTKGFESGSSSACNPILLPGNGVVEVPEGGDVPPTLPPVGPSPTAGAVAGGNQVHNGFLIPATTAGDLSIPEGWIHLESVVGESIADTDAALALVRAQLSLTPPDPWRRFVVLLAPDQTYAVYGGSSVSAEVPTLTGGYLWYWTFGCGFGQWWDGDAYQVAAFDGCGGADPGTSPTPDGSAPPEASPTPDGSPAPDGSPSPGSPEIPSPSSSAAAAP